MAKITLKYDSRNYIAKKTLDLIKTLGVFEIENANSVTIKAMRESKTGKNITKAKNSKDLFKKLGI